MKKPRIKVQHVFYILAIASAFLLGTTMRNMRTENPDVTATSVLYLLVYTFCSLTSFILSYFTSERDS